MRHLEPKLFTKMKPNAKAQRQWANLAHLFGNKRAQALVELAVFGTILLFCLTLLLRYGMNANYQQRVGMETFRKSFVRARSYDAHAPYHRYPRDIDPGWEYENAKPSLPGNHWRGVTYTVIEDKPIFSASGILPIVERTPIAATTDAVWSLDMFGEIRYGNEEDLGRVEYEINGRRYSFTVAAFKEYPINDSMRIKEDIRNWDGQGPSWRWKTVSRVKAGQMVDVDGDGYEEYIVKKRKDLLQVIDYQEGELNLSEKLTDSGGEKGGLQGYNKDALVNGSTFRRQEDASGITTTDNINSKEILTRTFITRDGDYNVVDEFPTQKTETWYTPNK